MTDAFQEDTTNHYPLLPLTMVDFDLRSNNHHKNGKQLLISSSLRLRVPRSTIRRTHCLVAGWLFGAIDERAYADKSQHARIQSIKKYISIP
jgi:hypothetical protein